MTLTKEQQEVIDSRLNGVAAIDDAETKVVDEVFDYLFANANVKGDDNAARFEAELRIYLRS